ncbi:thioredoxin domain-containing protein [Larkinella humicola]|uniref:Thioredoxin fold domain-containing protein n=1 Tax=Larkinella humicola TaxID=2607654 RepID=A0A5N1J3B2_9BACT|nr:thioredoxin domain-containing protein [Larkinella humicola]KAA9341059.1 thioredoxin fold domain-containing protein [Larkinella humicola]
MKTFRFVFIFGLFLLVNNSLHAQNAGSNSLVSFEAFEAKLAQAGQRAQILDARSEEEFQQNHLKGASSFNVADEADFQKKIKNLNRENPVFIYSIANGRSGQLARRLREAGFKDVTELPGGLSKWIGSGRSVESTVGAGLTLAAYQTQLKSEKLVLVDFGSRYCGSCKKLAPIVDEIEKEQAANVKVIRIEAYENKALVKELGITSLPTLVLYKGNQAVWKKAGVTPKGEIQASISESL